MASEVYAGSPAMVVVPMPGPPMSSVTHWPYSEWSGTDGYDERRQCRRRSLHCGMLLMAGSGPDEGDMIPGECLNACEGGLYGTVPVGFGVNLGQRYTFRLMVGERGPEPGPMQVVSQQGTIVRTELLMSGNGGEDRVGIGVRLIGHRTGLIPMPSW